MDSRIVKQNNLQEFAKLVKEDPLGNSFIVYNQLEVKSKMQSWFKALPWITPHYAIKSNPIRPLLEDILQQKGSFDCASRGEIQTVMKLGCDPKDIIYSNPVKNEKDLIWANKNGVQYTTADTYEELVKIKMYAPTMKILWRISIKEDNPNLLKTAFSGKFGDDINSIQEAEQQFAQIRKIGVQLHGIHFHCGSAQHGSPYFAKAVDLARACLEIGRSLDHPMELLDVGGGFPSANINENVVDALKNTYNDPLGYKVIAEPGRHFSSNSCFLAMRVMTRRIKSGKLCYHVNDSLYHSFNCILMDGVSFENDQNQYYACISQKGNIEPINQQDNCSMFGMTCDGRDVIADNMKMPLDMQVGDWMILGGMGSYTIGPKSQFNGMKSTNKTKKWTGELITEIQKNENDLQY